MKIKINKKIILENANSKFMIGVNRGFNDSPLPEFAVKNYSDLSTLKNSQKTKDAAIAQDLGLRIGSQMISKATIGGLAYGGLRLAQDVYLGDNIDLDSDDSKLAAAVPAVAAAWYGSDRLNSQIPKNHKKVFGDKSIYK